MIHLILTVAILGLVVYLIVTYVPMPNVFKQIITVIAVVVLLLYLMSAFGIVDMPVPRLR